MNEGLTDQQQALVASDIAIAVAKLRALDWSWLFGDCEDVKLKAYGGIVVMCAIRQFLTPAHRREDLDWIERLCEMMLQYDELNTI
jgi:hypothetical protein